MAQSTKQKLMKASDIPAFVEEVIKTGCNICAVGHDKYLVGDADLSPGDYENKAQAEKSRILMAIVISPSWKLLLTLRRLVGMSTRRDGSE